VFASQGGGTFTAALAAGSYAAIVGDAYSRAPLQVRGLVITAEGPNTFAFELAPVMSVSLRVADATQPAGAMTDVAFEGAPASHGFIGISPADADDSLWLSSHGTAPDVGGSGTAEVWLPETAGEYELRYYVELPEGGWTVSGRLAITVTTVSAALEAPSEAQAGSRIAAVWTGPGNRGDFITIVPVGAPTDSWNDWVSTSRSEEHTSELQSRE